MRRIFLPSNTSRARLRAAEQARMHRAEIVREMSWGRLSRRDLIKMGLLTGAGLLAPIRGLNPFMPTVAWAQIPTGTPPSPLFGVQPFTQPMLRFDSIPHSAGAPVPSKGVLPDQCGRTSGSHSSRRRWPSK